MKVAIIGAGNMGGAIARGLAKGSLVQTEDITVSNPSMGKLDALKAEFPEIHVTTDNREAARDADMVMLCVKPWLMEEVTQKLSLTYKQIVVSVAAGIPIKTIHGYITDEFGTPYNPNECSIFRLIPNTAISQGESMTLIAAGPGTTPEQRQLLLGIFNEMGLAMYIPEDKVAATTAMTSCGIAYALKYIQAAMQAGVELGVNPKDGMRMVAQSLRGAAELILQNDTHPAVEIDKVCTPGGITIRGINELEHEGFASALIKAIKASCK